MIRIELSHALKWTAVAALALLLAACGGRAERRAWPGCAPSCRTRRWAGGRPTAASSMTGSRSSPTSTGTPRSTWRTASGVPRPPLRRAAGGARPGARRVPNGQRRGCVRRVHMGPGRRGGGGGSGGLVRPSWLSAWQGRYVLSVYAEGESPAAAAAMTDLASAVAAAVGETGARPALVDALPAGGARAAQRPLRAHGQALAIQLGVAPALIPPLGSGPGRPGPVPGPAGTPGSSCLASADVAGAERVEAAVQSWLGRRQPAGARTGPRCGDGVTWWPWSSGRRRPRRPSVWRSRRPGRRMADGTPK